MKLNVVLLILFSGLLVVSCGGTQEVVSDSRNQADTQVREGKKDKDGFSAFGRLGDCYLTEHYYGDEDKYLGAMTEYDCSEAWWYEFDYDDYSWVELQEQTEVVKAPLGTCEIKFYDVDSDSLDTNVAKIRTDTYEDITSKECNDLVKDYPALLFIENNFTSHNSLGSL